MNTEIARNQGENIIKKPSVYSILNVFTGIFSVSAIFFGALLAISLIDSRDFRFESVFVSLVSLITGIYSAKFDTKDLIIMVQSRSVLPLITWLFGNLIGSVVFFTILIAILK